ncbi:hypothetical protein QR680_017853 [Steinernema hermaphroditum]|uniref:C-type lectin domain-containing protein n=1 Tax=Steinernema hermaphroditum TaxID=289476 RepID=A0AA39HIA5_9BILA|nr:hypothetical protein QR680_017853 [Steinernema hermaphroditum]
MKTCLLLATLVALALSQCPKNALPSVDNTKCFQFAPLKTNFIGAEQLCRQFGGHLASVDNAEDGVIIQKGAQQFFKGEGQYWIGGDKIQDFATWKWTDKEPFGFQNWAPGDVDIFDQNCLSVERSNGSWISARCCDIKPYVCEVPVVISATCPPPTCLTVTCPECPTAAPCPTSTTTSRPLKCAIGWSVFEPTDFCYRSYNLASHISWEDAEKACVVEGGHLASVHSKEENDFIGQLVGSASFNDDPWLGAFAPNKDNNFQWTDGSAFDFTNWHKGEPNKPSIEPCLEMYQDTAPNWTWNNVPCDTPRLHVYVCKKAKE